MEWLFEVTGADLISFGFAAFLLIWSLIAVACGASVLFGRYLNGIGHACLVIIDDANIELQLRMRWPGRMKTGYKLRSLGGSEFEELALAKTHELAIEGSDPSHLDVDSIGDALATWCKHEVVLAADHEGLLERIVNKSVAFLVNARERRELQAAASVGSKPTA